MSKHLRLFALSTFLAVSEFAMAQPAAIIPEPVSTQWGNGHFFINANTVLVADETDRPSVEFFNSYLDRIYGLHLHVVRPGMQPITSAIRLVTKPGGGSG